MLTLTTDKQVYRAGENRCFQLTGGPPNAELRATSFKDGVNYQYSALWADHLDSSGNLTSCGPLLDEYVGFWQVEIVATNPADGTTSIAQAFYRVLPADAPDPNAPIPEPIETETSFFDQSVSLFGAQIPTWALLGGAVLLLLTLKKR